MGTGHSEPHGPHDRENGALASRYGSGPVTEVTERARNRFPHCEVPADGSCQALGPSWIRVLRAPRGRFRRRNFTPRHGCDGLVNVAFGALIAAVRDALPGSRAAIDYPLIRSAIAEMRYISRSTGFSISLPSITTRPVSAASNSAMMRRARAIMNAEGVNTSFSAATCLG